MRKNRESNHITTNVQDVIYKITLVYVTGLTAIEKHAPSYNSNIANEIVRIFFLGKLEDKKLQIITFFLN